jgi:RimJ/RimL family protein N-acetyltransferase
MSLEDGDFMFDLLNDPGWLKFISPKGALSVDDAHEYIRTKILPLYELSGLGLFLTALKSDSTAIGICGLIKRESLDDIDIGFAFLPAFRGKGYAFESADAVMQHGRNVLGLNRIVAITTKENESSAVLLMKLGFKFEKVLKHSDGEREDVLFAWEK